MPKLKEGDIVLYKHPTREPFLAIVAKVTSTTKAQISPLEEIDYFGIKFTPKDKINTYRKWMTVGENLQHA